MLVRRAGAIGRRESVGAWLYRVAFRIAARAKMRTNRQRNREEPFADVPAPPGVEQPSADLRPIIDEELNCLPKKYRDPIVLRYFQEKTPHAVAAELSCPLGTVKTRLTKARELLRLRLARRGLALSAVALETMLGQPASAAVPAALAEAAAQAALAAVVGQAAGTGGAMFLAEGVLQEMVRTKLTKTLFGVLLTAALLAGGAGWLISELRADKPAAPAEKPAVAARAPARPTVPSELAWLPADTMGFLTVRVADLWDGKLGRELGWQGQKDKREAPNFFTDELLAGLVSLWTHDHKDRTLARDLLPKIKRLTLVFPSTTALADASDTFEAMAVTTRTPYDREMLLEHVVPGWEKHETGGKTSYAVRGRAGLHFVDERTFLVFKFKSPTDTGKLLARLHPKEKETPLRGALVLAGSAPVVFALNPEPMRKLLTNRDGQVDVPDKTWKWTESLFSSRAATVSVALNSELKADLFLSFPDRKSADEAAQAVKTGLVLLEAFLAQQRQAIAAKPQGLDQVLKVLAQARAALKSAPVRPEGSRLHVPVRVPVDGKTLGVALHETLTVGLPQARTAAQRTVSVNNLRQIALAMHQFHDAHGKFPAAATYDKDGKPLLSWRVALLPYLEEEALYKEFKLDEPWDSVHNKKLLARMPKLYAAPGGDPKRPHETFYQVFNGKGSVFDGKLQRDIAMIKDGTSQTLLVVEAGATVPWTKPDDLPYDPKKPLPKLGGLSDDDFAAAFADGHIQRLPKKLDEKTVRAIITYDGGEPVNLP